LALTLAYIQIRRRRDSLPRVRSNPDWCGKDSS
jgi:hypothetical protein